MAKTTFFSDATLCAVDSFTLRQVSFSHTLITKSNKDIILQQFYCDMHTKKNHFKTIRHGGSTRKGLGEKPVISVLDINQIKLLSAVELIRDPSCSELLRRHTHTHVKS
jgi:hypothetical protein